MPKRRSIPISFKKQVIVYVTERKCSVHAAYMHFKRQGFDYDEVCYYRWWKQKEKLMATEMSRKRCSGVGRPPLLGEMENQLYDKILEMRIRKMKVNGFMDIPYER